MRKIYIFFFLLLIDLRVENIFLIESSCRKETTPTRVGCRVVNSQNVGGQGCCRDGPCGREGVLYEKEETYRFFECV